MSIFEIPELKALNGSGTLIRIPDQIDVPVSNRVLRLIDTPEFQRLTNISQLGVVRFVYPGATHNRLEHSLGVYRNALLFLQKLASVDEFSNSVSTRDAELLILAALLHDVGHWPFAHPIEDMELPGLPSHEAFAARYLGGQSMARRLDRDWDVTPQDVLDVVNRRGTGVADRILGSVLSGPIDIDKMDYLYRDSLHAGVPYGQHFDATRLINSLCLNAAGDRLAITKKGKTAAELMVFARYVMFSEVYWHHAVRSATAMLQRAFFRWYESYRAANTTVSIPSSSIDTKADDELERLLQLSESEMIASLIDQGKGTIVESLLSDVFGLRRRLYKRVGAFGMDDNPALYEKIARRPYASLVELGQQLATALEQQTGISLQPDQLLIDAPPVGLEVQFDVDVYDTNARVYRKLGDVSPVVKTLARRQFDDFVKQVRVFVDPELRDAVLQADVQIESLLASLV